MTKTLSHVVWLMELSLSNEAYQAEVFHLTLKTKQNKTKTKGNLATQFCSFDFFACLFLSFELTHKYFQFLGP